MASQDKMTRDINNRVKKAFGQRTRSAGKLFLHTAGDFVTASFPAPVAMLQVNNDLLRDAAKFLRNPTDQINRQIDRATNSDGFKAIKKFAENALDDLKSGNLYDPERDRTEFGDMFNDDLMDFGGFDLTNYDENGDYIENTSSNGEPINMDVEIAKVQDKAANARTEATIDAIGQSTEAIVQTENSNAQVMLKMLMKQHQQNMQVNQNMMAGQQAIFELMNRSVNAGADMIAAAHNELMDKLDETNGLLRTIVANTTPPKPEETRYKAKQGPFGFNGELDIRQFFKQGIKNVDDKFGISSMVSMATMGMGVKDLVEYYQSNPWELIASAVFGGLVPKGTKKQMERTNNIMSNFLPAVASKLTQRGQRFTSGKSTSTLDAVLSLFFPEARSNSAITTAIGDYMKPAPFTAKTARAIEEVIPMWLSRIDSHIAGTPLMVYNYSTGKLENAGMTVGKYEYDSKNIYKGMGGAANETIARANKYKFTGADGREDKRAKEEFMDFVYGYFQHQGENSGFINPYASKEKFLNGYTSGDANKDSTYMTLLTSVMRAMGSDDPNKLFELANGVQRGRASRDRRTFYNNQELRNSGQIAAWSFMDPALTKAIGETALGARGELELSDIEDLSKALKVNTLKSGGVNASNVLLNDILSTLRTGIITYSYNFGKFPMDQFSKLPDYVQSQMSKYRSNHPNGPLPGPGTSGGYSGPSGGGNPPPEGDIIDTADPFRVEIDRLFETDYKGNGVISWYDAQRGLDWEHAQKEGTRPKTDDEKLREQYANVGKAQKDKIKGLRDRLLQDSEASSSKLVTILKKIRNEPFEIFNDAMGYADAYMTKMMFGTDVTDDISRNGEPYLFQTISNAMKGMYTKTFDFFKYKFTEKILTPVDKFLFDKENGIFPKIGRGVANILHLDDIKEKAKNRFNQAREKIVGTKGEDGQYSGGRVSDFMNRTVGAKKGVGETIMDAVKHTLYGDFAGTHGKGTVVDEYGVSGEGFVMGTQTHTEYGGIIGKIRQGFDKSFHAIDEALFGDASDDDGQRIKKIYANELKQAAPDMTIGAGLGAIGSLFIGGGSPILGAILGAGLGLTKSSSRLQRFLFGEFSDEEEEYETTDFRGNTVKKTRKKQTREGVVDRKITDAFKKYVPNMGRGAGIGAITGMFLPTGPVVGAILGGAAGFVKSNDNLRKFLFGDSEDPKSGLISKDFREKVMGVLKKYGPPALGGLAIGSAMAATIGKVGILPGLMLGPGGTVLGAAGAITAAFNADKIKNFFFGDEEDKDGKKKGAFSKMENFVKEKALIPLSDKIVDLGDRVHDWFRIDILGPLGRSMDPLKKALSKAGEGLKNSFLKVGDKIATGITRALGFTKEDETFGSKLRKKLEGMSNKLLNGLFKAIGGILSSPFKLLEAITNKGHIQSTKGEKATAAENRKKKQEERVRKREAAKNGTTPVNPENEVVPAVNSVVTSLSPIMEGQSERIDTTNDILSHISTLMEEMRTKNQEETAKNGSNNDFRDTFRDVDAAAERGRESGNVGEVYDRALLNAKNPEQRQAVLASIQTNPMKEQGLVPVTGKKAEEEDEDKGVLGKIFNFLKNGKGGGGLLAGAISALAATKLGQALGLGGIAAGGAGAAAGAASVLKAGAGAAILPTLGVVNAVKNREFGDALGYGVRGANRVMGRALSTTGKITAKYGLASAQAAGASTMVKGAAKGAGFITKLITKISEAVGKFLANKKVVSFLGKLGVKPNEIQKLIPFRKLLANAGEGMAAQLLKKCNIIIMVAMAVADFAKGMNRAPRYFEVRASDITFGQRLVAGLAEALSGIAFGLIPVTWFTQTLYQLIGRKEQKAELAENQANVKAELEQYNISNGTSLSLEEYLIMNDGTKREKRQLERQQKREARKAAKEAEYGTGQMKYFNQNDPRWNKYSNSISKVGCGPTVASMVASAYGKSGDPAEANARSYAMGMRALDGGTNPAFFGKYAKEKGFRMNIGPNSDKLVAHHSSNGRPVILMGKGGAFGDNMHYLVTDGMSGNRVNVVDPLTGNSSNENLHNLMDNVTSTVYSYGKGRNSMDIKISNGTKPGDSTKTTNGVSGAADRAKHISDVRVTTGKTVTGNDTTLTDAEKKLRTEKAQEALVNKMKSIENSLYYSLDGDKQDPDTGVASCASTVGWAYRKVFDDEDNFVSNPMSAGCLTQSADTRFSPIWIKGQSGALRTNLLQKGDIVYLKWPETDNPIDHAEMYIGDNKDLSHSGPGYYNMGPSLRNLNEWRMGNVVQVNRYKPFLDNSVKTYDDSAVSINGANDESDEEDFNNLTLYEKIMAIMSGRFKTGKKAMFDTITSGNIDSATSTTPELTLSEITNTAKIYGNSNQEKAWNYFKEKGLTNTQIAGIMGNLYAETQVTPKKVEATSGYSDDEYTRIVDNGTYTNFKDDRIGYGLAGFTDPSLKGPLLSSAQNNKKSISDLGLQLDILYNTLATTRGTLDNIKKSSTVQDATWAMLDGYERSDGWKTDPKGTLATRTSYANAMLEEYGTGAGISQNLSSLNNQISGINHTITRMRSEGTTEATTDAVTTKLARAIDRASETGKGAGSNEKILNLLTSTLGEMVGLLRDIKTNTAAQQDETGGKSSNSTKTVRADNYQANSKTYDKTDMYGDHGAKIVDSLTRV